MRSWLSALIIVVHFVTSTTERMLIESFTVNGHTGVVQEVDGSLLIFKCQASRTLSGNVTLSITEFINGSNPVTSILKSDNGKEIEVSGHVNCSNPVAVYSCQLSTNNPTDSGIVKETTDGGIVKETTDGGIVKETTDSGIVKESTKTISVHGICSQECPSKVTVLQTGYDCVTVEWTPAFSHLPYTFVLKYHELGHAHRRSVRYVRSSEDGKTVTETFTDLRPMSQYQFHVGIEDWRDRRNNCSDVENTFYVRTGRCDPILNTTILSNHDNTSVISWNSDPNHESLHDFLILFRPSVSQHGAEWSSLTISDKHGHDRMHSYVLENLVPNSKYTVQIWGAGCKCKSDIERSPEEYRTVSPEVIWNLYIVLGFVLVFLFGAIFPFVYFTVKRIRKGRDRFPSLSRECENHGNVTFSEYTEIGSGSRPQSPRCDLVEDTLRTRLESFARICDSDGYALLSSLKTSLRTGDLESHQSDLNNKECMDIDQIRRSLSQEIPLVKRRSKKSLNRRYSHSDVYMSIRYVDDEVEYVSLYDVRDSDVIYSQPESVCDVASCGISGEKKVSFKLDKVEGEDRRSRNLSYD